MHFLCLLFLVSFFSENCNLDLLRCFLQLVSKVKQISIQSDLTSMSSFAGPSYLTIRSSVFIILLYFQSLKYLQNQFQLHTSGTSAMCIPFQWTNHKNTLFFCYSLLLGQFQPKSFYCGEGRQNFASNVTLYPCERSHQNHLDRSFLFCFF